MSGAQSTTKPGAGLRSKRHRADDFAAAQEVLHSRGWTDGLPVVPPMPELVAVCLEWALMPPEQLVGVLERAGA